MSHTPKLTQDPRAWTRGFAAGQRDVASSRRRVVRLPVLGTVGGSLELEQWLDRRRC